MKYEITEEYIDQQLKFALLVAIGLDTVARHENALNIVQAAVTQILMGLGYDELEAYSAAVTLHYMKMDVMINDGALSATLPALVSTAARVIGSGQIPENIRAQVKKTLAEHGK